MEYGVVVVVVVSEGLMGADVRGTRQAGVRVISQLMTRPSVNNVTLCKRGGTMRTPDN